MREKNCGWRIDVFYPNEGMMQDVISTDIHNDVHCLLNVCLQQIMGSDHCPISLTFKDTLTETFPTPSGAGNIRKATKQQVCPCITPSNSDLEILFQTGPQER
jgi:hypothetical protein